MKCHLALLPLAMSMGLMTPWFYAHAASLPAIEAQNGMVVSSQHLSSQVGIEMLKMGGNAIDAAVAVGYAEAVVDPCCGNIGGGGFMTLHLANGKNIFINFRETAPAAASRDMYLDATGAVKPDASLYGYLAAGVPGTVLGLDTVQKEYGTLTRAQVMAPAIRLAREGFTLIRGDTEILDTTTARFKQDHEAAKTFLRADGSPLQPGDKLVQKDLAATLQAISDHGPQAFYHGTIPQAVERAARENGGLLTAKDFADYRITQTKPVSCSYRGYEVISSPPPSSGGTTLCESLNILEGYDLSNMGFNSAASVHYITEALRHAFMDRNTWLGDPDFVKNPLDKLLSKDYASDIRRTIPASQAARSQNVLPGVFPHEKLETTHYSVMDKQGNAVSTTFTINGRFGAVVIAPGTGFFLNDEMDDFTSKIGEKNMYGLVQGANNAIAAGKRPLSSMSPTLVTKDGKIFMVLGSPGGPRIISITLETILNVIDYGMTPQEAVDAPRIHHQWLPDVVYYEPRGLSADTLSLLQQRGYKTVEQTPWGSTELIIKGSPEASTAYDKLQHKSSGNDAAQSGKMRAGYLYGASDVRRPSGAAIGY